MPIVASRLTSQAGTRPDLHAANHAGGIAVAKLRGIRAPTCVSSVDRGRAFVRVGRRQRSGRFQSTADFAGNADVAQAVGPIAGDFQVDGPVAPRALGGFVIQPGHHQPLAQVARATCRAERIGWSQSQETSIGQILSWEKDRRDARGIDEATRPRNTKTARGTARRSYKTRECRVTPCRRAQTRSTPRPKAKPVTSSGS